MIEIPKGNSVLVGGWVKNYGIGFDNYLPCGLGLQIGWFRQASSSSHLMSERETGISLSD
jgi:hypothetical protein